MKKFKERKLNPIKVGLLFLRSTFFCEKNLEKRIKYMVVDSA